MIKRTNQIWTDFKEILDNALAFCGVSGWTVRQNFAPVKGNWPRPVLVMHRIRPALYGAQGQKYISSNSALTLQTKQYMELTLQIDALCSRVPGRPEQVLASDVIIILADYFTGPFGSRALKDKGYALAEKIRTVEEPEFTDENDVFEFNPFLQMKISYINTTEKEVPALDALEIQGVKGV